MTNLLPWTVHYLLDGRIRRDYVTALVERAAISEVHARWTARGMRVQVLQVEPGHVAPHDADTLDLEDNVDLDLH